MQNTAIERPTNPEHFPVSSLATTTTTTTTLTHNATPSLVPINEAPASSAAAPNSCPTAAERTTTPPLVSTGRPQNFSFASNYNFSTIDSRLDSTVPTYRAESTEQRLAFLPYAPVLRQDKQLHHPYYYQPLSASAAASAFTILSGEEDCGDGIGIGCAAVTFSGKPNAIVRPIQRPAVAVVQSQTLPNGRASLQRYDAGAAHTVPAGGDASSVAMVDQFTDELNRKLRFLRNRANEGVWAKASHATRNGSHHYQQHQQHSQHHLPYDSLLKRPLFITTVPSGVFLPPPQPLPTLRGHTYAYSSHPVVLYGNNGSNGGGGAVVDGDTDKNATLAKDKRSAPIVAGDKRELAALSLSSSLPASMSTNVMRRFAGAPQSSLVGEVHLTRQQFQQQLQQHRTKREPPPEPYKNVMYDRRVVRGSNYGPNPLLVEIDPFDKAAEMRRRLALRKKRSTTRNVLGTPPPVHGRRHEQIQTEKHLEELLMRPGDNSVTTQTDLYLERVPDPPYVPAKTGVDASTEIADGELFHFDYEAQPIIDVLVDSCLEQSMLEVAHELEIAELRKKQEEFLALREAELAELRRLEAQEFRLQMEKDRRLRQEAIAKELDEEMQKGVTAAKLLQGHIASLLPEVLENLEPATDAAKKEHLMKTVCPWLSVEVAEEVGQIVDSREILTVIIQEIIKQRAAVYVGYKEDETPIVPLELPVDPECVCEECEEELESEACACESSDNDPCQPPLIPESAPENKPEEKSEDDYQTNDKATTAKPNK